MKKHLAVLLSSIIALVNVSPALAAGDVLMRDNLAQIHTAQSKAVEYIKVSAMISLPMTIANAYLAEVFAAANIPLTKKAPQDKEKSKKQHAERAVPAKDTASKEMFSASKTLVALYGTLCDESESIYFHVISNHALMFFEYLLIIMLLFIFPITLAATYEGTSFVVRKALRPFLVS